MQRQEPWEIKTMKFLKLINPLQWVRAYKEWRAQRRSRTVSEFAHKHKDFLVIVLDPVEDTLFMAHRDQQVFTKIKTADGKNHHIVKNVIKASQFKGNIDYLLAALAEALKSPLANPHVMEFIKWVDAAAYRLGINLRKQKEEKIERQKHEQI